MKKNQKKYIFYKKIYFCTNIVDNNKKLYPWFMAFYKYFVFHVTWKMGNNILIWQLLK